MHNAEMLLWCPLTKPQTRDMSSIVIRASIWIKAIILYLHFLCGWALFDMQQKEQAAPPVKGQLWCRLTGGTVKEGSQEAELLSDLLMDTHMGAASWPALSERK